MQNRSRRRWAAYIVEFAFVAPIVMTVLIGSLEWCRYIMTRNLAEDAAREGARYAICRTDITQTGTQYSDITTVVTNYMNLAGGGLTNIQAYVYKVNTAGQPIDVNGNVITQAAAIAAANESNWYQSSFGQGICVTLSATYAPVTPGMLQFNATLPLQVTAVMGSEGN